MKGYQKKLSSAGVAGLIKLQQQALSPQRLSAKSPGIIKQNGSYFNKCNNLGRNIMRPMTALKMETHRTAPAEISLITLIAGLYPG